MSGGELDKLLEAQRSAIDVLSAAKAEAKRMVNGAEAEAVAVLLEQQAQAERLLTQQRGSVAKGTKPDRQAHVLLESHREAAELLAATEVVAAAKIHETRADDAVDVLMAGHRKAAAILLDAWMQITEARPPAGDR